METITLTITAQTLNTIGAALRELPFKVAAPAIQEIEQQVQKHLAEKQNGRVGTVGESGNPTGAADENK